jgi:hypothetical protein
MHNVKQCRDASQLLCKLQGTVAVPQQQVAALHDEVHQLLQQAEKLAGESHQMLAQRMRAERHLTQLQVRQMSHSTPTLLLGTEFHLRADMLLACVLPALAVHLSHLRCSAVNDGRMLKLAALALSSCFKLVDLISTLQICYVTCYITDAGTCHGCWQR